MMPDDDQSRLVLDGLRRIRNGLGGGGVGYSITTWQLAEELERDHGMPASVFAQVMRSLIQQGAVVGRPMLGTPTNWHVTSVR